VSKWHNFHTEFRMIRNSTKKYPTFRKKPGMGKAQESALLH